MCSLVTAKKHLCRIHCCLHYTSLSSSAFQLTAGLFQQSIQHFLFPLDSINFRYLVSTILSEISNISMLLVCMFHMLLSLSLCCCVGTGESGHWSLVSLELRFLVMMSDNVGVRLAQDSEQCCIRYIGFTIGFHYHGGGEKSL